MATTTTIHQYPATTNRELEAQMRLESLAAPTTSDTSTTICGLDGGVRRMGLETQTSPVPSVRFLLSFLYITLLNNDFLLDYMYK
jgi:hypothetical protein